MKNEKLNGKDLMNFGIYTAISFLLITAVAMLGFIPILMPLLTVICPIVGGIPIMLFYTKVKKFGMIWLMTFILGLLMWITGMGMYPTIVSIVCGLIADLIYKSGNYKDSKKAVVSYAVSVIYLWGNFIELFFNIEKYFSTRQDFGQEYIDTLTRIMPIWMCPVLLIVTVVSGIVGGILGCKIMKKHFIKAGIA